MNKRERLIAAMNNQPVDRPPVGLWFHYPENATQDDIISYTLRDYAECDLDMVKIMSDGYFNYPNPLIRQIRSSADWYSLKPLGEDDPWIRNQVERVKAITGSLKDKCCVFYNVFNPMSYLKFETSDEFVMEQIRSDKEAMKYAFSVMAEDVKALIRGVMGEGGCDGLYYCVQNAELNRFSEEEYRDIVRPSELELLKYANSIRDMNILHCCGWAGDKNRMEVWKDYPSKVVNWAVFIEGMSLPEGKKFFGGRAVLGGLDNRPGGVLMSGSDQDLVRLIARWKQENTEPGMIIGADCTIPREIDKRKIRRVIELAAADLPAVM